MLFSVLNLERSLAVALASPWAVNSLTVLIKLRNYCLCSPTVRVTLLECPMTKPNRHMKSYGASMSNV